MTDNPQITKSSKGMLAILKVTDNKRVNIGLKSAEAYIREKFLIADKFKLEPSFLASNCY